LISLPWIIANESFLDGFIAANQMENFPEKKVIGLSLIEK
jgi:hypothetical protein